jgi:Bifunctional DNA primase/polymerase, N-terminal
VPELLKTSVSFQQAVVAALKYANGGMAVFPVRADKTPITPHGAKDATRDPASITAWWRLYPYAEIGWAIPPSAVVIDIDRKPRQDGYRDFERLTGLPVDAFETPQTTTPSGGRHLFCKTDGDRYRNCVRVAGTGVDVRSAGGYVVLPSVGSGRAWVKPLSVPLMKPPAWLPTATEAEPLHSSLLRQPRSAQTPPTPTPAYRGDGPYGLATLKRVCADVVASPKPRGCV